MDRKNSDDYKTNIFKRNYNVDNLDDELIQQAKYHDQKAFELRKEAGLSANLYVLATHPIITLGLAKKGRRLHFTEMPTEGNPSRRYSGIIDEIKHIEHNQLIYELDTKKVYNYRQQTYVRITMVVDREETMPMATGVIYG